MSLSVLISSATSPTVESELVCPPLSLSLGRLGFSFVNDVNTSDFFISFNHSAKLHRNFKMKGGTKSNSVLVRSEPVSVYPAQYQKRIENLYGQVFTLGATTSLESQLIAWPYYYNQNPLNPNEWSPGLKSEIQELINEQHFNLDDWKRRSYPLSMVASNKVSPVGTNNYQLR